MVDRQDSTSRGYPLPYRDNTAKPDIDRIRDALVGISDDIDELSGAANVSAEVGGYFIQADGLPVEAGEWAFLAGQTAEPASGDLGSVDGLILSYTGYDNGDFSGAAASVDLSEALAQIAPGFIFRFGPQPGNDTWVYFMVTVAGQDMGGAYIMFDGAVIGSTRVPPGNNGNRFWQLTGRHYRSFVQARDVANPGQMVSGDLASPTTSSDVVLASGFALATLSVQGLFDLVKATPGEHTQASPPADKAATPAGVKASVDAAVAALVDSAPAALDTLNELAAALGDNANFAATVTAALAGKASQADLASRPTQAYVQQYVNDRVTRFVPPSGVAQSGSGNAIIALTPNPAPSGYSPGQSYEFVLESDISANASINVSGHGNKEFAYKSGSRVRSLKGGFAVRVLYDGTRFLMASLVAAVMTATAVEFTASSPAYAWPYTAPKCLVVIEGAGGGGGGGRSSVFQNSSGGGGGSGGGLGGSVQFGGGSPGTNGVGDNGGVGGAMSGGAGGNGGNATKVTVKGVTTTAHGGGGGAGDVSRGGGTVGQRSETRNGGGGNGRPGGSGGVGSSGNGGNGGAGLVEIVLIDGLQIGDLFNVQIGAGGNGGGNGGVGSNGRVTLYPIWA